MSSELLILGNFDEVSLFFGEWRNKKELNTSHYISSSFSHTVNNFPDFLFDSPKKGILPKWGLILEENMCSFWSKFISLRIDPHLEGGSNETGRVASH